MKILRWLDEHFEAYILIALSILTVVVIFIQVIMRYVIGASLVWSEEFARYLFIWMIYIGVSFGVKKQRHLSIDAFAMLFKEKGKIFMGMCANLAFLFFAVIITYYSYEVVMKVSRLSPAMEIPLNWVYAAPMVGFLLTSIRIIQNMKIQFDSLRTLSER